MHRVCGFWCSRFHVKFLNVHTNFPIQWQYWHAQLLSNPHTCIHTLIHLFLRLKIIISRCTNSFTLSIHLPIWNHAIQIHKRAYPQTVLHTRVTYNQQRARWIAQTIVRLSVSNLVMWTSGCKCEDKCACACLPVAHTGSIQTRSWLWSRKCAHCCVHFPPIRLRFVYPRSCACMHAITWSE